MEKWFWLAVSLVGLVLSVVSIYKAGYSRGYTDGYNRQIEETWKRGE